jgi:DNA-binding transcriptional ArsR family regulator
MDTEQLTILFGSKTRVKLLRHFLADPEQKYYVRELTRLLDDHINAIRHELSNLENAGLVTKKKSQGRLYYRLNRHVAGMKELRGLFAPAKEDKPPTAAPVSQFYQPRPERPAAPELGDVKLLLQNGKFVGSNTAPADLLVVGEPDEELFKDYLQDLEEKYGEIRYSVMSEEEYVYRRGLFDRFITQMLSEPKKLVVNNLKDKSLARL